MPATQASASLFSRLGGKPAVETVVTEFYKRVLADRQLKGFFQGKDMQALYKHQVAFISQALGGPKQYAAVPCRQHTPRFALRPATSTASPLISAVPSHGRGVAQDDIKQVIGTVGTLKADVVNA